MSPEWVYEWLERDLFDVDNSILINYCLSKPTRRFIANIRKSMYFDDILIHYLCKNNIVKEYFPCNGNCKRIQYN